MTTIMPNMPSTSELFIAPLAATDRISTLSRGVAVGCTAALIILAVGWELVWARTGHGSLFIKALPLLIALPGLLRYRLYTYRWLSMMVWLYVAEGIVRITDARPVPILAALEITLALALFIACATQVRRRLWTARDRFGSAVDKIIPPTLSDSQTDHASRH